MHRHASLNRAYRLVFDRARGTWVVAPETARSVGGDGGVTASSPTGLLQPRLLKRLAWTIALALSAATAWAADPSPPAASTLPMGGRVVAGSANLSTSGSTMTVGQASQRAIINWSSFDVGSAAAVNFVQPNAAAVTLNRVTGGSASQIFGRVSANGQIYLVNPAGVLIGRSAQVDAGGLVASTLGITDADFLAGRDRFTQGAGDSGSVVNQGRINVGTGGRIALLGTRVSNQGQLLAPGGDVALVAGRQVTLAAGADGHLQLSVDAAELATLVSNSGLIHADGGTITLTARGASALASAVVSNTGTLQARTVDSRNGRILLLADLDQGGRVEVNGALDASAPAGGNGGFIEASAQRVQVADGARVSTLAAQGETGRWLVDPTDFTIGAGGAAQSASGIGADTLGANLANTNITLQTAAGGTQPGDIHVNAPVSWSANTLTLNAANNIDINAVMTAGGTAGLALNYGGTNGNAAATPAAGSNVNVALSDSGFTGRVDFTGTGNSLSINGAPYTLVRDVAALQGIDSNLSGRYALANDIDASATVNWNGGAGFSPIGLFSGTLDGLGHVVNGLTINRPGEFNVGLVSQTDSDSTFRNLGLTGGALVGRFGVGSLIGAHRGSISNVYATSSVSGTSFGAGGLVGIQEGGSISNAYVTGGVSGAKWVGGLVGQQNGGSISDAYATGSVSGGSSVGGLVGIQVGGGSISNAYATGNVSGDDSVGGLVGGQHAGVISNAYAAGAVSGVSEVGGLVGFQNGGSFSNAYVTGSVSGGSSVGGLVGLQAAGGSISNAYVTGSVSGDDSVGGLVGRQHGGVISNAYAAGAVSGVSAVGGLVGLQAFSGSISNAYVTGNVSGDDSLVGGLVGRQYGGSISNAYAAGAVLGGGLVGGPFGYPGGSISNVYWNAETTGQASSGPGCTNYCGLTTAQMRTAASFAGWDLATQGGSTSVWRIYEGSTAPLLRSFLMPVTVTGGSKTYDGTVNVDSSAFALSGPAAVNPGLILGQARTAGKDVGTHAIVDRSGLFSTQQGYDISFAAGGGIAITPRAITGSITAADKVYDGTTTAAISSTLAGVITGDSVSLASSGSFVDKSAGVGKTVAVAGSLNGADAGNYTLSANATTSASITPKAITGSIAAADKVYDGTITAATSGTLAGVVAGDSVAISSSGSFADKNAGMGKAVTVAGSLTGVDAGNYTFSANATTSASITPRGITGSITAADKVYDGTTTAATSGTLTGVVAGDSVAISSSGSFVDKNAGTGKAVTVAGSLTGADAGNYAFSTNATTSASITPRGITGSITAADKVYDGTTTAATSGTPIGVITGDSVSIASSGSFADRNAGTGKAVTAAGSLTGVDAGNYAFSTNATTSASITPRGITGSITAADKVYDGTATAATSGTLIGVITGDSVSVASSGNFADKNAGVGKRVTVAGSLAGGDAGNYVLDANASTTASITPATLVITANDAIKPWNGQPYAGGNGVRYSGFVPGEDASVLRGTPAYGGSAQGASLPGLYGLTASGLTSDNYRIQYHDGHAFIVAPAATLPAGQVAQRTALAVALDDGDTPLAVGRQPVPLRIALDYIKAD